MSKNPDEVHGPVVAVWTASPSGNLCPLCKPCLDYWLDNADDEPDLEPSRLDWVPPFTISRADIQYTQVSAGFSG